MCPCGRIGAEVNPLSGERANRLDATCSRRVLSLCICRGHSQSVSPILGSPERPRDELRTDKLVGCHPSAGTGSFPTAGHTKRRRSRPYGQTKFAEPENKATETLRYGPRRG